MCPCFGSTCFTVDAKVIQWGDCGSGGRAGHPLIGSLAKILNPKLSCPSVNGTRQKCHKYRSVYISIYIYICIFMNVCVKGGECDM